MRTKLTILLFLLSLFFLYSCSTSNESIDSTEKDLITDTTNNDQDNSFIDVDEPQTEEVKKEINEEASSDIIVEDTYEETEETIIPEMPYNEPPCGMKKYEWLNKEKMGEIVDYEPMLLFSMSKETLKALLDDAGYGNVVTIKNGVKVYLYRYVTQDRGVMHEATSVLAIPDIADENITQAPEVLWLHGTSGFTDQCAPSKKGGGKDAGASVALVASQGYICVAPDYLGMNGMGEPSDMFHPYLVAEPTAIASLDSLRGAHNLMNELDSPVKPDGRLVLWGGSQGGHAVLVTSLFAPYYAPEFNITAVVALIPPADLIGETKAAVSNFSPSTIALAGFLVASSRWYGYNDQITKIIQNKEPYYIADTLKELMDTTCSVDESKYEINSVDDIFTQQFVTASENDDLKAISPFDCIISENSLQATTVKLKNDPPVLYVLSQNDELVEEKVERKEVENLCALGYDIDFKECMGASHTQGAVWSLPEQFEWVKNRFDGKPLDKSKICKLTDPVCCSLTNKGPCTE